MPLEAKLDESFGDGQMIAELLEPWNPTSRLGMGGLEEPEVERKT